MIIIFGFADSTEREVTFALALTPETLRIFYITIIIQAFFIF